MTVMITDDRANHPPLSVLGRAMSILHCFDATARQELSLGEVTAISGLPKATVHRLLGTLSEWQMIERTSTGFRLGIQLFELGMRVPRQFSLRDAALPYLLDLHQATKETVQLAVLDGTDMIFLAKIVRRCSPRSLSRVGGRVPAHCTGVGKAFLAFADPAVVQAVFARPLRRCTPYTLTAPGLFVRQLEAVRDTGLAQTCDESVIGTACVASPVFAAYGKVVAAISVTGSTGNFDPSKMGPAVRTAALAISRDLSKADNVLAQRQVS
ncbi:MAG: IclR family transcriptional regulator [Actinomycetota bacterium]|nr:IclR family transcriptional regulator [Actinomycetota bacterium]